MKQPPINRNVAVIGPTGSGKTVGWVIPSILSAEGSVVVTDTKGTLYGTLKDRLERQGYDVQVIDFVDPAASTLGFEPLDFIQTVEGAPCEYEALSLANALCPVENDYEPFWDYSARAVIASLIGYVLETLPEEEIGMPAVFTLFDCMADGTYERLIDELAAVKRDSFAAKQYAAMRSSKEAERTVASVRGVTGEKLAPYRAAELERLYRMDARVDFSWLRRCKTALFIHVSDCDRAMDRLVALFYGLLFKELVRGWKPGELPVDVIMDDFACGTRIDNFDGLISIVRSRDISACVILQSLAQLEKLYGRSAATIVENCDTLIYLGGNDLTTAGYFGSRLGCAPQAVLALPPGEALVLQRGAKPRRVEVNVAENNQPPQLPECG